MRWVAFLLFAWLFSSIAAFAEKEKHQEPLMFPRIQVDQVLSLLEKATGKEVRAEEDVPMGVETALVLAAPYDMGQLEIVLKSLLALEGVRIVEEGDHLKAESFLSKEQSEGLRKAWIAAQRERGEIPIPRVRVIRPRTE